MSKPPRHSRVIRAMMAVAMGGSALQLSGCDPVVRATLIEGLEQTTQALSSALISAFFLSLQDEGGGLTTTS